MLLGYNTNGFGYHRLDDALEIISELGYGCVALTLDVHHFNPFEASRDSRIELKKRLDALGLTCVIETGARYLLDPKRKHRPTLLDDDAGLRLQFLQVAMELGAELEAHCVSYWSGARPQWSGARPSDDALFKRLADHVDLLEERAQSAGVTLAFEPEPGFLVESMADFDRLCSHVGRPLGLTLDVGHLKCVETEPPENFVKRYADRLYNVQLDDMKAGVHEHLMFGEGEVNFPPVFEVLREIGYEGPACVELSSHSRNAVEVAKASYAFLAKLV